MQEPTRNDRLDTKYPLFRNEETYQRTVDPLVFALRAQSGSWSIDLTKPVDEQFAELEMLAEKVCQ